MPLAKYILRPGINREGTDYSNEGGWFDANLDLLTDQAPYETED